MDHETAVKTGATERYLLGELTGEDRDRFEEHYFMCPECAEDVGRLPFSPQCEGGLSPGSFRTRPHAGVLFSAGSYGFRRAECGVVGVRGYGLLKARPDMKQALAEARAPQFVQDVPVLG